MAPLLTEAFRKVKPSSPRRPVGGAKGLVGEASRSGAMRFNFRRNDKLGDFQGHANKTSVGPSDSSYPTDDPPASGIYADAYEYGGNATPAELRRPIDFDHALEGRFRVCSLTRSRPGRMRSVCIDALLPEPTASAAR